MIFAEGASETVMRVALSLMRKNEEKILACTEIEDVMQLLLSRGLWDCYHYNADDFVNDFVGLTGVVTHESLQALEVSYHESKTADAVSSSETIGSAASRFLGRLWATSNSSTKSANLSPGLTAPTRPVSFLRRSPSKQSIASTMNSTEGGPESILSSTTDATTVSRDSTNTDGSSIRGQSVSFNNVVNANKPNKDKNLHGQIEDLLMALSEMQRDHAILATQLQKEREEREEDRVVVRSLLDGLKNKSSLETVKSVDSEGSLETVKAVEVEEDPTEREEEDATPEADKAAESELLSSSPSATDLTSLLDLVESRFTPATNRRSSMLQSKSQLREELARSKEQLIIEVSKTQDFSRRLNEQDQEISNLKEQLRDGHTHIRNAHAEKQRLEKQIHDLRVRAGSQDRGRDSPKDVESINPRHSTVSVKGGLRELKLGRSNSNRGQNPTFNKRTSSLASAQPVSQKENESPILVTSAEASPIKETDVDALVLELVQAKTAEAVAKQEAEEAKAKLESLRKMLGMGTPSPSGEVGHRSSPSLPQIGIDRSNTLSLSTAGFGKRVESEAKTPASAVGGFWGGWGKRTVSTEKAT